MHYEAVSGHFYIYLGLGIYGDGACLHSPYNITTARAGMSIQVGVCVCVSLSLCVSLCVSVCLCVYVVVSVFVFVHVTNVHYLSKLQSKLDRPDETLISCLLVS